MLRAEMQDSEDALILRLDGRFTGDDAEHVRMLVTRCNIETRLIVDLTGVTFVDSVGEATLAFFRRLGAKFVAEDAYILGMCERLHLSLARNGKSKVVSPPVKPSRTPNHG
jgi:anti-anti-sigma factor